MSERIVSDEFDGLDATEKAGIEAALNRCRALAAEIARELRNKRSDHVDKLSLADLCASLEHAADVLGQKGRQPAENIPAPVEKGSRVRHR
jgi:glutathione S-transferase